MQRPLFSVLASISARQAIIYMVIVGVIFASGGLAARAISRVAVPYAPGAGREPVVAAATPSYVRDIAPILDRACVRCHGQDRADKGLRMDSYRRTLAGDNYGAVLIPGKSSLSAIVSVVKYGTMPHDGMRLPAAEIDAISRWIDAGAPEN